MSTSRITFFPAVLSSLSRPSICRLVLVLVLASQVAYPLVAQTSSPVSDADITRLAQNFDSFFTGASSRSSSTMTAALSALESAASSYSDPDYLRGDGSWSDINYAEVPSGNWSPWDHFRRLTVMAKAYRTPGQRHYRSASMRAAIESALNYSLTFYSETSATPGNWWFWRIGVPLDLAPTLVLMRDDITLSTLQSCTRALNAKIGPSAWFYPGSSILKGENLAWSAFTHLGLGILRRDASMLSSVRDAMTSVCSVAAGDGIQRDMSFQQHGAQLYTGGYGASFANDATRYELLTRGTAVELPVANLQLLADYLADGVRWSLYQNHFDVSAVGREVSKPTTTGYNGLAALIQLSEVASTRQGDIRSAAVQMTRSWNGGLPVELAAIASRFSSAETAAWPSGQRDYRASDYVVHRRRNYFASVKMLSSRTKSGERTNGENILGSRQSDGRFYLVLRGDEYFSRDVWPTLDWSRLPGITVEQRPGAASDVYGTGTRSFVGATGDETNGAAAMDFAAVDSPLTAKKSWIFFDDAIVFLTNSVNVATGNHAETIIQQWPLSTATTPLVVDGVTQSSANGWQATLSSPRWAHADNVGYYFPEPISVSATRETRSGAWSKLGAASTSTTVAANPILTMWVDHGAYVANGTASYVIVPAISATAMQSWAATQPVRVLANDNRVSAARDERNGSIGAIFWQPAAVVGVASDAPSIVYVARNGNAVTLTAADPRQSTATLHITLPGSYALVSAPAGTTLSRSGQSSVITLTVRDGATTRVDLALSKRTRQVRR